MGKKELGKEGKALKKAKPFYKKSVVLGVSYYYCYRR